MPLEVGDRVVVMPTYGNNPPNLMKIPPVEVGDTAMTLPIQGSALPITIAFPSFDIGSSVFVIPALNLPGVDFHFPSIIPPGYIWWRPVIGELSIYCSVTGRAYQTGDETVWSYFTIGADGYFYSYFDTEWAKTHPDGDPIPDLQILKGEGFGEVDIYFAYTGSIVTAGRDTLYYKGVAVCSNPPGYYGPAKYAITVNLVTGSTRVKT